MVRWMSDIKVRDREFQVKRLRERLGLDDVILILQQNRLRWYGHVLRKENNDWLKKYIEYDVEGARPRGIPKRTWRDVVQKDGQKIASLNEGHCEILQLCYHLVMQWKT